MTGALPDVGAGPRAYQRIGGREMILAGVGALAACGQALNILTRVLIFSSCEGLITNPQAPDVEWSRAVGEALCLPLANDASCAAWWDARAGWMAGECVMTTSDGLPVSPPPLSDELHLGRCAQTPKVMMLASSTMHVGGLSRLWSLSPKRRCRGIHGAHRQHSQRTRYRQQAEKRCAHAERPGQHTHHV